MRFTGISSILFTVLVTAFSSLPAAAQASDPDSLFYQKAINNAVSLYHLAAGDQSGLYNGSQYPGYPFEFKDGGHPYFIKAVTPGTILYDKLFYPQVKLLFDELADQVVFEDSTHRIQLLKERISKFTIGGANFVRIENDSSGSAMVNTGFYQVLYGGARAVVLKKEIKKLREEIRFADEGILRYIDVKLYYYIRKGDVYYSVGSKKTVLSVYKDRKKELQQYIKTNRLSFKKDRDNMLEKLSAYYDQLTK
jgi:hypothetical protein